MHLAKRVKLLYDVLSPYSWIGFEILSRYQKRWNIDLVLKPFLLGAVIKNSGNSPPWLVKNKGIYVGQDLKRLGKFYNIPLNIPKDLHNVIINKGSLSAMRLVTAVQAKYPDNLEDVSREFWMRIWSRDEDICKDDSLKAVLEKVGFGGEEIKELMNLSKDKLIADKLKQATNEAIDAEAFGAPIIICNDQDGKEHMLFGSDRMELLASLIGEKYEGPLVQKSKL